MVLAVEQKGVVYVLADVVGKRGALVIGDDGAALRRDSADTCRVSRPDRDGTLILRPCVET